MQQVADYLLPSMSPEAPTPEQSSAEHQDQTNVRFQMEERIFDASDTLERMPDSPDKQMLRHVLSAAWRLIDPTASTARWKDRSPVLRMELENALNELRQLEEREL